MRFVFAAALGAFILTAPPLRAGDLPTPPAVQRDTESVYTTTGQLPGTRVESVLTDPWGAATSKEAGTGWLLQAGPPERNTCDDVDATSGLRMMCVAW